MAEKTVAVKALIGLHEIATMLGWSKSRVSVLRTRGNLPTPLTELACGPIYDRAEVAKWAKDWERTRTR